MWRWHVIHFFVFHFDFLFFLVLSFIFVSFFVHSRLFTFVLFVVLGGFVIACRSIQRHIVALESDIDIYKSVLLPMRDANQEHTARGPSTPLGFCSSSLEDGEAQF